MNTEHTPIKTLEQVEGSLIVQTGLHEFSTIDESLNEHKENRRRIREATSVEFDYDQIDINLGFVDPNHPVQYTLSEKLSIGGEVLEEWLKFAIEAPTLQGVGGRMLGMALCMRPDLFDSKPASQIASLFGLSRSAFNKYLTSVNERFGLKSTFAKKDGTREKNRIRQLGKATHSGLAQVNRK